MSTKPPLFKGQAFRLVTIAVGLVIVLGLVFVVEALVSGEPMSPVLLIAMGVALVVAAGASVVGLLLGRRIFGQRLELALRPAGETKWRHGRIEATTGHMRFTPYRWQMRFVSGEPVDFEVTDVGTDSGQRPSKKQLWSVNPTLHVIEIETDRGAYQVGLQAHQVDEIRERLTPVVASH